MTAQLSSSIPRERNEAALGLAKCGSEAGGAVPYLMGMLYDANPGVQSSAAYALRQIDTPQARAAIAAAVEAKRSR